MAAHYSAPRQDRRTTGDLRGARLLDLLELKHFHAHFRVGRAGFRLLASLGLLLAHALEGAAYVGVEARLVAERRIEDVFHAGFAPTLDRPILSDHAVWRLRARLVSPDYHAPASQARDYIL